MMNEMFHLAQMLAILAQCPSAKYCMASLRLDCGACPYRPPVQEVPLHGDESGQEGPEAGGPEAV